MTIIEKGSTDDPRNAAAPCGVLCLNKPTGVTSRDVVDRVVRPLGRKVKVGHAGTLDPLASGVLVVCVGAATRLIEYVQRQPKTYRTVVRLGARSDTHDADGTVTRRPRRATPRPPTRSRRPSPRRSGRSSRSRRSSRP